MSALVLDEIRKLEERPLPGVSIKAVGRSTSKWRITIDGPPDTAYRGRKFTLNLNFPEKYPDELATLKFASQFIHSDVAPQGNVALVYRIQPREEDNRADYAPDKVNIRQTLMKVLLLFRKGGTTLNMQVKMNIVNSDNYQRYLRRYDELYDLYETPLKGIHIITRNNNSLEVWRFIMFGHPESTLYAKSYFSGLVVFPSKYPNVPPKVYFKEEFYHPGIEVETMGEGTLRYSAFFSAVKCWKSTLKMRAVFKGIKALMFVPRDPDGIEKVKNIVVKSRDYAKDDRDFNGGFPIPETIEEYNAMSLVRVPFTESEEH